MSEKLYIVLPAYNEQANIETVVNQWHDVVVKTGPDSRLVIVNDGSTDNTFELLQELKETHPQLIPVNKSNSGHGASCLFAYNYAIDGGADYIFQTDSDGQTDPVEFGLFWENRKIYDFIIGHRSKRQDGAGRIFVTRILRLIIRIIFGEAVKDPNTPFRLMNTKRLKPILEIIPDDFFLSNALISMLIVKRKEQHVWVPISFRPRQGGINSINFKKIIPIGQKAIGDFYSIKKTLNQNNQKTT